MRTYKGKAAAVYFIILFFEERDQGPSSQSTELWGRRFWKGWALTGSHPEAGVKEAWKRVGAQGLCNLGLLPTSSNALQLCWASKQEKWDRARDIKDKEGAGPEARTQRQQEERRTAQGSRSPKGSSHAVGGASALACRHALRRPAAHSWTPRLPQKHPGSLSGESGQGQCLEE